MEIKGQNRQKLLVIAAVLGVAFLLLAYFENVQNALPRALATFGGAPVPIAQHVKKFALDVAPEMVGLHTDMQVDFQRHELRAVDLDGMTGHAIPLDVGADVGLELVRHYGASFTIDRHEDRMPAARPAKRGGGPLHVGSAFGHFGVISLGHGTLLYPIGHRRALAHVLQRFRILPTNGRQRIPHQGDFRKGERDVDQGIRPNVPGSSIAYSIGGSKPRARFRPATVHIISEANPFETSPEIIDRFARRNR